MYTKNGVFIDISSLVHGKFTELVYKGYLFEQGAEEVYVHLGFGLLWEDLMEVKMTRFEHGFEARIPIKKADTLNFCFRDNYNNWDNNFYQNYSYEVKKAEALKVKPVVKKIIQPIENIEDIEVSSAVAFSPLSNISNELYANANSLNKSIHQSSEGYKAVAMDINKSLVTTFGDEFAQFRRLPDNYIRNKKLKIMFYKAFAYVPRLLNGYDRRRTGSNIRKILNKKIF